MSRLTKYEINFILKDLFGGNIENIDPETASDRLLTLAYFATQHYNGDLPPEYTDIRRRLICRANSPKPLRQLTLF